MKDRLKEIRKSFPYEGKTQESFAKFLGVPKPNLSSYETGRRTPSDAFIQLVCEKCNVDKEWLLTGKGDMKKLEEDKLSTYLAQIAKGDDGFIRDIIKVYMELDPSSRDALKTLAAKIANERNKRGQD